MTNKEIKLITGVCLDEIESACRLVAKPITRRIWLQGQIWHKMMIKTLIDLGYKGKVRRYPKHVLKKVVEKEYARCNMFYGYEV